MTTPSEPEVVITVRLPAGCREALTGLAAQTKQPLKQYLCGLLLHEIAVRRPQRMKAVAVLDDGGGADVPSIITIPHVVRAEYMSDGMRTGVTLTNGTFVIVDLPFAQVAAQIHAYYLGVETDKVTLDDVRDAVQEATTRDPDDP